MGHLGDMTISYKVKINKYILGSLLPKNQSFELQVKQSKKYGSGHLQPLPIGTEQLDGYCNSCYHKSVQDKFNPELVECDIQYNY